MNDIKIKVEELVQRLEKLKKALNLADKGDRVKVLENQSADPSLWNDQDQAKQLMQELAETKKEIVRFEELAGTVAALVELSREAILDEDLKREVARAEKEMAKFELKSFLSGPYDAKGAIMAIHAGQGGTEAMDWVSMLLRMYLKYCEEKGWQTETLDSTAGEEAGIKSVTFRVEGAYAYGYLKGEAGTHRLVRQSPFNADNLRQTSFALVEVLPELAEVDLPDIEIKNDDVDWQFFRSSSKGGQNVQKVSTAVRLTHKPTGIMVTAQTERFQEQNREIALNLLRAKLWLLQKTKEENTKKDLKGNYRPASWGTQIRSYVLHPYKMVKDLRTGVETASPEAVLNGDLDEFIEAELKTIKVKL